MNILIDFLFDCIHLPIIFSFFYGIHSAKNKWVSIFVPSIIFNVWLIASDFIITNQVVRALSNNLIVFLLFIIAFYGKILKKLITFLVYFLISFACDFLVFTLTGSLGIQNEFIFTIVMYSMMCVLLYLSLTIAARFMSDFGKIYDKRLYLAFILIPIAQYSLITVIVVLMNSIGFVEDTYQGLSQQSASVIVSAILIFTLIADLVFLDVTRKAAQSLRDKEQLKTLETEARMNYKYYESLQKNADIMRKYRHDTNNIIQSIYALLESNNKESADEAFALTKHLEQEINSVNISRYCSHTIVNAVIFDKEKLFSDAGIDLKINVAVPQDITVPGLDLCRVFSNLLDNALEASRNCSDKAVTLDASIIDGYLYIKLRNPVSGTSETKDSERGNGLIILKQISEKYSGETITSAEHGMFETLVTLKCSE